jgi:hypothetical protein
VLFTVFDVPATFVESKSGIGTKKVIPIIKLTRIFHRSSMSYLPQNRSIVLKLLCDRFELYGDLSVDGSFNPTGVREFL